MKIAHLVHQFLPETHGGLESYVADLATAQQAAGDEILIISSSLEPRPEVTTEPFEHRGLRGLRIHRNDLYFDAWDRMYAPQMTAPILDALRDFGAEVVHLHHWIRLGQDIGVQLHEAGFPIVVTLHDFATSCPRAFRMRPDESACFRPLSVESCLDCVPRWPFMDDADTRTEIELFRRSALAELSRARRIVTASASVEELIRSGLGTRSQRFRIIPLGYQPRFRAPSKPKAPDSVFRFAYWGSITHRKGLALLVEAVRSLVLHRDDKGPRIELEVFGGFDLPEREQELRRAAEGLPVRFHGRFEYAELEEADIHAAVFPSLCIETYGLVLDEAFELGLPVVVPDIGALADRSGAAGRRFEAQDSGSLARAMGAVVDDPAVYRALLEAVPGPGPDLGLHAEEIGALYREALADPVRDDELEPAITPAERLRRMQERSELMFRKLLERGPN